MPRDPIPYDPTRRALYHPDLGDPIDDFSAGWTLDQICCELSRLSYYAFEQGDGPRLDRALANAGFSRHAPFAGRWDAQAFGTSAPDGTRFVVFRGTQAVKAMDVLVDLRIRLKPWRGLGRIHQGFRETFESLEGPIGDWLADRPVGRLVVTGHSLGAAMATVMAAVRAEAELVTFGSPRVGDAAFVARFEGRTMRRYVDCTDGVTMVPPEFIGYRHIEPMRYVDRLGIVRPTPPGEAELAQDRRTAHLAYAKKHAWKAWRNVLVRSGADHAPINYVSAMLGRRT